MNPKFWNRYTTLQIGNKIITSNDLDIYFNVKTDTKGTADIAEVSIFNLSDTTKQSIYQGMRVNLQSGYKDDYGTIFTGEVNEMEDESDGADIKTTITCLSDMKKFFGKTMNKTYPAGTKLVDIAKDQIQFAGITVFKIDDNPKTIERAVSLTSATNLGTNLTQIAEMLDYTLTERRGSVLLVKKTGGIAEGFVLNSDTGLLEVRGVLKRFEGEKAQTAENTPEYHFEAKSLLIYNLAQGSIIDLDSKVSGKKLCRVESCEFVSNQQDHIVNMKLKIL